MMLVKRCECFLLINLIITLNRQRQIASSLYQFSLPHFSSELRESLSGEIQRQWAGLLRQQEEKTETLIGLKKKKKLTGASSEWCT